ncbi:MAG: hypothetical protein NTW67_03415 [Candidatus Woesearchaeota archaeon]|nr:hypothetical protein [Candidatus Woesearchaeota archaeon]
MESKDLVQILRITGIHIPQRGDILGKTRNYEVEVMLDKSPILIFTNKKDKWQAAFNAGDLVSRVAWTEGEAPYKKDNYEVTYKILSTIIKEMQNDNILFPIISAVNIGLTSLAIW